MVPTQYCCCVTSSLCVFLDKVLIISANATYRSSTTVFYYKLQHISAVQISHHQVDPVYRYTRMCPTHSPLLGNMRRLRTSNSTQVCHFKVITSRDVRICVNMCTALSIALANIDCKTFFITHIFIILPCFYPIYFTVPYRLYLRNSVTLFCIGFNFIIPFLE